MVVTLGVASGCQSFRGSDEDGLFAQGMGAGLGAFSSNAKLVDIPKDGDRHGAKVAPGQRRTTGLRPPSDTPEGGNFSAVPDPKDL